MWTRSKQQFKKIAKTRKKLCHQEIHRKRYKHFYLLFNNFYLIFFHFCVRLRKEVVRENSALTYLDSINKIRKESKFFSLWNFISCAYSEKSCIVCDKIKLVRASSFKTFAYVRFHTTKKIIELHSNNK